MIRFGSEQETPRSGRAQAIVAAGIVLAAGSLGAAGLSALLVLLGPAVAAPIAIATAAALALALLIHRLNHSRLALVLAAIATIGGSALLAWRVAWSAHGEILALGLVAAVLLDRDANPVFRTAYSVIVTALTIAVVVTAKLRLADLVADRTTAIHGATTVVLMAMAAWLMGLSVRRAESSAESLHQSSRLDSLTGLLDRHAIKETLEYEAARSRRNGLPFSIMLAEIDNLKNLKERYGERCGDWVLPTTANILRKVLRQQDHLSRWANSRFLLLLPDTDADGGRIAAERIRAEIQRSTYLFDGTEIEFTLTLGVAAVEAGRGLAASLAQMEDAVAAGAEQGGDQVVVMAGTNDGKQTPHLDSNPFVGDEQTFEA